MNSIYEEFKNNPWDFITKKLKIDVFEKHLENEIINNNSNLNYRNLLIYQNNGLLQQNDILNFELFNDIMNILTIFYIFELDTYILQITKNLHYSCINEIIIINKDLIEYKCIELESYNYGQNYLYYIINKDLKLVYFQNNSEIYLEGNINSNLKFFKQIKYFKSKCSIRIYSIGRNLYKKDYFKQFKNNIIINKIILNNTNQLYPNIKLFNKVILNESIGLNVFKNLILTKDKNKYINNIPFYLTGINLNDYNNFINILSQLKLGNEIKNDYKLDSKLSYNKRFNSYCFLAILKDSIFIIFFNSKSKQPFYNTRLKTNCIIIFLNYYNYFIGEVNNNILEYNFNDKEIIIQECNYSSYLVFDIEKKIYKIRGNFKNSFNLPFILNDNNKGNYKGYYFKDSINFF